MIVQIKKAAGTIVEGVSAVTLRSCPCQVQELELCVCVASSGARGSHLPVVLRDVAEFVPHA